MRKSIKALIALFVFGSAAIAYMNWAALEAAYLTLATMPVLYWGMILAIPALLIIYKIGHGSELFAKLKFWKWLAEPKDGSSLIPQAKRFEIAREFVSNNWKTEHYMESKKLALVDNQICSLQSGAATYEIFQFAAVENEGGIRIGTTEEIPTSLRFFVVVNCKNGEAETARFGDMGEAYRYIDEKFTKSLPRAGQEMAPIMKAIEQKTFEGFGLKLGEKAGERAADSKSSEPLDIVGDD